MDNNKPVTELPVKAPFDFAKWWDRVGILIVLLVLLILMSTFAPNFNRVDNLLNIARSISVNAILAAGMTFVILTSGIDLSVGSIVAVSGVIWVVAAMAGIPAPLAILAGVGCGIYNSVETACGRLLRMSSSTEPEEENTVLYRQFHCLYQRLYSSLKEDFKELAGL